LGLHLRRMEPQFVPSADLALRRCRTQVARSSIGVRPVFLSRIARVDVAGSTPVSRSKLFLPLRVFEFERAVESPPDAMASDVRWAGGTSIAKSRSSFESRAR